MRKFVRFLLNLKAIQQECEVPETGKMELPYHFQYITLVTHHLQRIILAILICISERSYMNCKSQNWVEIISKGKKIIQENKKHNKVP